MRVLIACEQSGVVRDAFTAQGHDAWSCDLVPSDRPGNHFQGDALNFLDLGWDLLIAHPPCTYLCNMGIWWNHKRPERKKLTQEASAFVRALWNAPIERICIENPPGWLNSNWMQPTQTIQPWQFGHEANKPTSLWLRNLPPLKTTKIVSRGEFYVNKKGLRPGRRCSKWLYTGTGNLQKKRATTFQGIAEAMALTWQKNHPVQLEIPF